MVDFSRAFSLLVVMLCVIISLSNEKEADSPLSSARGLQYDYYRHSCPSAEKIIRSKTKELYLANPTVAPAMLRLVFHDCFVQGCDASVLLDTVAGNRSEKEMAPNHRLKGFDVVDTIKSHLEEVCPGVVSCADIIVLAAQNSVLLAGGPFYPLLTGRRDITESFPQLTGNLPSPHDNLNTILDLFHAKGFDEQETVSLLGAHSVGDIHCSFIKKRLSNFSGTGEPDATMDTQFVEELKKACNKNTTGAPPDSDFGEPIKMDYEGARSGFGSLYYRSLLQGRGILFSDQQLTAGEATEIWVRAYAADTSLFQKDFGTAMFKLSNLQIITAPSGEVRLNCSRKN